MSPPTTTSTPKHRVASRSRAAVPSSAATRSASRGATGPSAGGEASTVTPVIAAARTASTCSRAIGCRLPHTTRTSPANVTRSASAGGPGATSGGGGDAACRAGEAHVRSAPRGGDRFQIGVARGVAHGERSPRPCPVGHGPRAGELDHAIRAGSHEVLGRAWRPGRAPRVVAADRDPVDLDDAALADPPQPRQSWHEQHPFVRRPLQRRPARGPSCHEAASRSCGRGAAPGWPPRPRPDRRPRALSRGARRCRRRRPFHRSTVCARSP